MIYAIGSHSAWPMQTYRPEDLPTEGHVALRARIVAAALWWGLNPDEADEAGSQFYLHWLSRQWEGTGIPRGDHQRAIASVLAYAKKSHWHGFTGQRRQARGKRAPIGSDGKPVKVSVRLACAGELRAKELARLKGLPPAAVAEGVERIEASPSLRRKAGRLARRLGVNTRTLVREACGFSD